VTAPPEDNPRLGLLEAVERDAWLDMYAAAPPEFAKRVGLTAEHSQGVTVLTLAAVPDTQFNRILGLGVEGPASEALLDQALERMRSAGTRRFFLHLAPVAAAPKLAGWMGRRGLVRYHRPWAKFHRGPGPALSVTSDLAIAEIGPDRAMDFARPVAAGFAAPPPFQAWLAALPGRAGWRIYAAYSGTEPVAGGALYCRNGVGWLGITATAPAHRRRGAQTVLLARQIADAIATGCRDIAAETGVPVPGEPNHSYANMLRAGFEIAYLRDNYLPVGESPVQSHA
jgi:hypothetical protein